MVDVFQAAISGHKHKTVWHNKMILTRLFLQRFQYFRECETPE